MVHYSEAAHLKPSFGFVEALVQVGVALGEVSVGFHLGD